MCQYHSRICEIKIDGVQTSNLKSFSDPYPWVFLHIRDWRPISAFFKINLFWSDCSIITYQHVCCIIVISITQGHLEMKMCNLSSNLISYQVLGKVTACKIDIGLILRSEISFKKYFCPHNYIENTNFRMFCWTNILIIAGGMIKWIVEERSFAFGIFILTLTNSINIK